MSRDFTYEINNIKEHIIDIKDFPIEGVTFKDISPLIADNRTFRDACFIMAIKEPVPDYYVAMDARGFLFAGYMPSVSSNYDKAGILMCRKKGKLPGDCVSKSYSLEYGENILELRKGVAKKGSEVIIIDDVLATGGTALCACRLCEEVGLKVRAVTVLIELEALGGRNVLETEGYKVNSIIKF